MRLSDLLIGLISLALALIGALVLLGELPGPESHARFATMLVSGGHPPMLRIFLGWVFGILIAGILALLLVLGVARGGRKARLWLTGGFVVYAACITVLLWSYAGVDGSGRWPLVLSFPAPTSWMLFVLWPLPFLFAALWIWKFREWVWAPEDEAKFREILATARAREHRE
jgi:hypothetical protein